MRRLGLDLAGLDLIVTPEGETIFLEVNAAGQWLWVQEATGMPIASAIVDRLLARSAPLAFWARVRRRRSPRERRAPALPRGPYLVLGLGKAGNAAAEALLAAPVAERVHAWDSATAGAARSPRDGCAAAAWTCISAGMG